jgi:hypothetical protein
MGFLGSIGKALGGAVTGFLSTGGNPIGAIVGGVGGLLSGGGGSSYDGNGRVGTYIPPTVQEAFNIAKGLKGKIGDVVNTQYNIEKPYLDEALSIFRSFPNTLNQLFGDTESRVANRYASLFSNIQNQMTNQWSKSALGLSALGMYNTPATQLTQSDIVDKLFGRVAEQETQALNQLDISKMSSLVDYYSNAPQVLSMFGETFAKLDPSINRYQMELQLAGLLNGLNTVAFPKESPLSQARKLIDSAILNNAKNLPSWDDVKSGFDKILGIFNRGSRTTFSTPSSSFGWSSALNNALPVPKLKY